MLCPRNYESQKINSNGEASFISHVLLRKLRFAAVQSLDGQVEAICLAQCCSQLKIAWGWTCSGMFTGQINRLEKAVNSLKRQLT